ncbi:alpha/beta hydrolase [Nocardia stercoris]|uniref:Alpha/beta hydrolase n=1 Tax=Nocardia stercoris TaxID=2483361 RepID=A0A3M2KXE9_9NOCA|nr:alpha/beta fold hydrolase [Nocardia stercoris]RMI30222.1 alpha/beta hydrolase [Nocardia stercoris]
MTRHDTYFVSGGLRCAAWHYPATSDALATRAGRPCVVMANGFGGTRDTGLQGFAESFSAAGIDVYLFDFRHFGDSEGEPRQLISVPRQRQDFHAAVDAARRLPGVDRDRIALWGSSYSAGHAIVVAAQSPFLSGVVAMTPFTDGLASLVYISRIGSPKHTARLAVLGAADLIQAGLGKGARTIPITGPPGTDAMMTAPGVAEAYTAAAGPTWRNATPARHALAMPRNRPTAYATKVDCPVLVQVAKADKTVPNKATRKMAAKLDKGRIEEYPVDHFDVYDGPWHRRVVAAQLEFLTRVLR